MDETRKEHPYIQNIELKFEGGWSSELASLKLLVQIFWSLDLGKK